MNMLPGNRPANVGNFLSSGGYNKYELYLRDVQHPEDRLSTAKIHQLGYVAIHNLLAGYADESLLPYAAYEFENAHLAAGALVLGAYIEQVQAGVGNPTPLMRSGFQDSGSFPPSFLRVSNSRAKTNKIQKTIDSTLYELGDNYDRFLSHWQTMAFMPAARRALVSRFIAIRDPESTGKWKELFSNEYDPLLMQRRNEWYLNYLSLPMSYWDMACLVVGHNQPWIKEKTQEDRLSQIRPQYHKRAVSLFWTDKMNLMDLTMVLDVANPFVGISLAPKPSLIRRVADAKDEQRSIINLEHDYQSKPGLMWSFIDLGDAVPHFRQSHSRMRHEARKAIVEYASKTTGAAVYGETLDEGLAAALLVAEVDRFKMLTGSDLLAGPVEGVDILHGFLPAKFPNAEAINGWRVDRLARLMNLPPQFVYYRIPPQTWEDAQRIVSHWSRMYPPK